MLALLRQPRALLFSAAILAVGCELAVPFDDESQPCGVNDECLPGFICKSDNGKKLCKRGTDAGVNQPIDSGHPIVDSGHPDAGDGG